MTDRTQKILLLEDDTATTALGQDWFPIQTEAVSFRALAARLEQREGDVILLGRDVLRSLLQQQTSLQQALEQAHEEADRHAQARTAELAQAIATLREQVLETKRLEEEIRRENQELAILNSIPATVSTSLDLTEVLLLLKQQLSQQLGVPGGCIYLYDQQEARFELKQAWGVPEEALPPISLVPATSYPATEILSSRKPFLVAEIKADPLYQKVALHKKRPEWQSCLGVPVLADGTMQGVIVLFSPATFNDAQIAFYTSFGRQVGAAFHHARLFAQFFAARERTQVLSQRLVTIQEEERRYLARELHDEVGQILTGLKLILEMSLRLPPEEGRANVQEAQKLVGELMSKVRQISLDLRPGMLDDLGLLPALLWYFERYTMQTQVQVRFIHRGLENRFATEVETAAYRIVQEALTNVARHAGVQEVYVNVWADAGILSVEIEDHGAGFDAAAALAANLSSGLAGMGERARLLGGGLTLESNVGDGTRVIAHLPL